MKLIIVINLAIKLLINILVLFFIQYTSAKNNIKCHTYEYIIMKWL